MSLAGRSPNTPLLPQTMAKGINNALLQGLGLTALCMSIAGWTALGSWSVTDPSLNNGTSGEIHNLLGFWGASLADFLFQGIGLTAVFIFLPLAAWGFHFLIRQTLTRPVMRILCWPVAISVLAIALATIQAPKSWPLHTGLGGALGDQGLASLYSWLDLMHLGPDAAMIGTALFLPALGLALLSFSSGIGFAAYALIFGNRSDLHKEASSSDILASPLTTGLEISGLVNRLQQEENFEKKRQGETEVISLSDRETHTNNPPSSAVPQTTIPVLGTVESGAGRITPQVMDPTREDYIDMTDGQENPQNKPSAPSAQQIAAINTHEKSAPAKKSFFSFGGARAEAKALPPASGKAGKDKNSGFMGKAQPNLPEPGDFLLPSLEHLSAPAEYKIGNDMLDEALKAKALQLLEVLEDFGIKGQIINVRPGPVVTLYELEPARGVKAARIIGLADDIARYMSAVSARVAVIPGKNVIGIELPNTQRQIVYMREQLESHAGSLSDYRLPLVLGKNIGGDPVTVDLASMPHLLIAGTTGSGKSVGINTMILSLLYSLTPQQCKFIMIDPKMLELSVYDGIPHLLSPVVTDPKKAVVALKWTVKEMEERYAKMSKLGVRNIDGFNARVDEISGRGETMTRTIQTGFDAETGEAIYEQEELQYEKMPYIVVVVDEMADLMVVAGKEIEGTVQRLAQMARAAGIHIIMATQRPSVDVITGTIKANFPTRISFQVTSKIDSRTILGETGAEQLLGKGDMLYMGSGIKVERVHGAFVSDEEVEEIAAYLKSQGVPQYLEAVTRDDEEETEEGANAGSSKSDKKNKNEALYDEAVAIVLRDQKASTSYIQRRLSIGYNRAASLIERMEIEGLISPANNVGRREIFMRNAEDEDGGMMH